MKKLLLKLKNRIHCFFVGHKWHSIHYQPLIVNNLQIVSCKHCHKTEEYIGDGNIWYNKNNPNKKLNTDIWIVLIDKQREMIEKSLTCKSLDDN